MTVSRQTGLPRGGWPAPLVPNEELRCGLHGECAALMVLAIHTAGPPSRSNPIHPLGVEAPRSKLGAELELRLTLLDH